MQMLNLQILLCFSQAFAWKSRMQLVMMDGWNSLSIHSFSTKQHLICTMKALSMFVTLCEDQPM
jgi:hypothetical protein